MDLHALAGNVLWVAQPILQTGILVLMLRRGMRERFPMFFHYTIFQVLSSVGLMGVYRFQPEMYFNIYWTVAAVSAFLSYAVIFELFSEAFRPYASLRDLGRIMFRWSIAVMSVVGVVLMLSAPGHGSDAVIDGILSLERAIRITQCAMLLLLYLFSSHLGLTWRNHLYGLVVGYGVYASTELVLVSLRSRFGVEWAPTWSLLHAFAYTGAVVLWFGYVLRPEAQRNLNTGFALVLTRWNKEVAKYRVGRTEEVGDALLPNIESTVARVMAYEEVKINQRAG